MTKIFLTIHERTAYEAEAAVAGAGALVDGFELRLDAFDDPSTLDLLSFRRLSDKPMILTRRSRSGHDGVADRDLIELGLTSGFELVDIEFGAAIDRSAVGEVRDRIILSYHDFEEMPDLLPLLAEMRALGCAQTKIAVTPRSFRDNQRLLEILATGDSQRSGGLTLIGLGASGVYSRILAPMFGSEILFVARDEKAIAAPGQLTLRRAAGIFGTPPQFDRPRALFAIVGNPATHSLSPAIHNERFRAAGIAAAYSILEVSDLDDAVRPFAAGVKLAPMGLSVTAPFKEDAFRYAERSGAAIAANAQECGAVNTLVRRVEETRVLISADNTDVDAFEIALSRGDAQGSAIVFGAGGTARAALVALRRRGIPTIVANRGEERGRSVAAAFSARFVPLEQAAGIHAEIVVDTIPSSAAFAVPDSLIPNTRTCIAAGYDSEDSRGGNAKSAPGTLARIRANGAFVFTGLDLLHAQAERQSQIFLDAARHEIQRQHLTSNNRHLSSDNSRSNP